MRFLIFTGIFTFPYLVEAQLTVNNTAQTPAQLVQNVLLGSGVTVSNITFNGVPATSVNSAVGSFNGSSSNIGLSGGVIMGSGDVQVAPGPNNSGSASMGGNGSMGTDPDLQAITPNQIYDEAILEFDFVPVGDSLKFRYVFASEEYDEYVCATVNDAFGFFLSGPGISGPYTNNAINIATIPGTNTPVSINTVNLGVAGSAGTPSNCSSIDPNWASYNIYYAGTNTQNSVQYDGFTIVLEARAVVQCGQLYHIKLAIGDAGDGIFDSGVFLEENSFSTDGVGILAVTPFPNNTMIEGCGSSIVTLVHSDTTQADTVILGLSGNAISGTDYNTFNTTVIIPAGSTSTSFNVDGLIDNLSEGTDTLIIELLNVTGCNSVTIYITDYTSMSIVTTDSINICTPGETGEIAALVTGGAPPLIFTWDNGAPAGDTVNVSPPETTQYNVTVTDGCNNTITGGPVDVWVQCMVTPINVFTPNGDGVNETLHLINLEDYPDASITVYNRWGQVVFEKDHYRNDWAGKHIKKGDDVPEGVYYYIVVPNSVKYTYSPDLKDDLQYTFSGHVTILR